MIRCSRSTTLRSAGEKPNRPRRLADMLLTELDAIVTLAAVSRSKAECVFGLVDALEDRREKHVIRLGRIVRTGPPAPRDRHDVRDLQPVDRHDVVARTNARRFGFGPDWKADSSQVVLVERNACAAADDKRRILPGLVDAIPDAGERSDDRQQKRWDPDQLEEDQSATRQVGDAVRQAKLRRA